MNPLWMLRLGGALAVAAALAWGYRHVDQGGFNRATSERAARDSVAIANRVASNTELAIKQDAFSKFLTKDHDEKLAPVVAVIRTERVRIGPGICGPAAPAETGSASGGNAADTGGRLVREDIERDLRALEIRVEEALATGRACQAFVAGQ